MERSLSKSPRSSWKYLRNLKRHPEIPVSVHFDDHSSNNRSESANLFSNYLKSVVCFPTPSQSQPQSPHSLPFNILPNCFFSLEDIISALSTLYNKTSKGPNTIPAVLLFNCHLLVYFLLYILFRWSLEDGKFPNI